jgi:muramoyltetrapeptide carboxypeptidase
MILIDPPQAVGFGRLWSHLASDTSYDELHAFARAVGIPARGFDRDHYDVPADHYDRVVEAGATPISSRDLVRRLHAAGLRRRKSDALRPRLPGRTLVLPRPLRPGDRVAVVAPAGPAEPARGEAGIEVLREWGLSVDPLPGLPPAGQPWLAGSDEGRADGLTRAWADGEVRAVFATRGGFGSQRLLDLLDWATLAQAGPAWLVGYSDVTALHQAFATRLGVATAHGPGVATLPRLSEAARESLRTLLFDGRVEPLEGVPLAPGEAVGPLVGGNLAVLAASAGTEGVHPARDSVALLEDVNEAPYRLDRLITQLLRSGWMDGVRGVALGRFTDCGDPVQVRELLRERLAPLGVPVVADVPVGHDDGTRSVVLGRRVVLDGRSGRVTQDLAVSPAG